MSQVKVLSGKGIPLVGDDIDTDRIIPARFLRCVTFDGLGAQVFKDDRTQSQGQHPFDLPQYQGASILVVNSNFGCGSSREHAPQALAKWGIKGIIGESFAEIFFGNCVAMGIPCVTATPVAIQELQELLKANPQDAAIVKIDLEAMIVSCSSWQATINLSQGAWNVLTTGTWDSCSQLITQLEEIRTTAERLPYLLWA